MEKLGPRVRVQNVEALNGFTVRLTFENGVSREVNLRPFLRGPVFEAIRSDPAKFRAIRVDGGTVAWDNGADIDPDVLYYGLRPAWAETPAKAQAGT